MTKCNKKEENFKKEETSLLSIIYGIDNKEFEKS